MKEKKIIRTVSCLCVVLMACGTAFAQQGKGKFFHLVTNMDEKDANTDAFIRPMECLTVDRVPEDELWQYELDGEIVALATASSSVPPQSG